MRAFFNASTNALNQITRLFIFTWGTDAAIWNLRWQYRGLKNEIGTTHGEETIKKRLIEGSGINGVDFNSYYDKLTWEDHQEELTKYVLFVLFSVYESWLEELAEVFGIKSDTTKHEFVKGFQFITDPKKKSDIKINLKKYVKNDSSILSILASAYQQSNKQKKISNIDNTFIAYRLFKEIRNTLIHGNTGADKELVLLYSKYASLSNTDLGLKEKPFVHPIILGNPIITDLRGVVGFSEILIRILLYIDNELMKNSKFEKLFVLKTTEVIAGIKDEKDKLKIKKIHWKLHFDFGYPNNKINELEVFLKSKNII